MKRFIALFIGVVILISNTLSIYSAENNKSTEPNIKLNTAISEILHSNIIKKVTSFTDNYVVMDTKQGLFKLSKNVNSSSKKEWFILYKQIIDKGIFDPPETIYDYYSDREIEILHRIVEAECTGLGFNEKVNVANVIFNRINSEQFPNTIEEVVFQKNPIQFSPISDKRYYSVDLEPDTLLAVEYAFMIEDTTNGCLFFDSNSKLKYKFIFNDGAHNFYKIKEN